MEVENLRLARGGASEPPRPIQRRPQVEREKGHGEPRRFPRCVPVSRARRRKHAFRVQAAIAEIEIRSSCAADRARRKLMP